MHDFNLAIIFTPGQGNRVMLNALLLWLNVIYIVT